MTDENQVTESQEQVVEQVDYKAMYEKSQADLQAIVKKKEELLNETKKAKQLVEQERLEKAKKDGDYESILKSVEEQKKEWESKYQELQQSLSKKQVRERALQIANDLKPLDGDAAETLADYIEKRIKLNDNSIIFLDSQGNPSVMDAESLKNEFKNSNKFKPLLRGSLATGGGAPGSTNTISQAKEISRADFNKLDHVNRRKFFADGGKLTD